MISDCLISAKNHYDIVLDSGNLFPVLFAFMKYVKNGIISLHSTLNHGKSKSNFDIQFTKLRDEIKGLFNLVGFFFRDYLHSRFISSVKLDKV